MSKAIEIQRIELMFQNLNRVQASGVVPPIAALSQNLRTKLSRHPSAVTITVNNDTVNLFGTASVEMWHRSIHSLLMSANLTSVSPLWSSVAGYYSSHYVMRGLAHLLGFFQLFTLQKIAKLNLDSTPYYCDIISKDGKDKEHKLYWKIVHASYLFKDDPLFYDNNEAPPPAGSLVEFRSDMGHRNRANYADHIGRFPIFNLLEIRELQKRLQMLASIQLNDIPVPSVDKFPDLDSVQILAYHRILKYRSLLDEILPPNHRYWSRHRTPPFSTDYFNFSPPHVDYSGILADIVV